VAVTSASHIHMSFCT